MVLKKGSLPVAETHPELMDEWSPKNTVSPWEVSKGSEVRVWWECRECHYEWETMVNGRRGCPACAGRVVFPGVNDVATLAPSDVLAEWDYEKNTGVHPSNLLAGSSMKVWWRCRQCGHQWRAAPYSRIKKGQGCSTCAARDNASHQIVMFADKFPELVPTWVSCDGDNTPYNTSYGSNTNATWLCLDCRRNFSSSFKLQSQGKGCPHCAESRRLGRSVALNPDLMVLWDTLKNTVDPKEVSEKSSKSIVWWLCPSGHSYSRTPNEELRSGQCPVCLGRSVLAGFNDLETLCPGVVKYWDFDRNDQLPSCFRPGSQAVVAWLCPKCDYRFTGKVDKVTNREVPCPRCSRRGSTGERELFEFVCSVVPDGVQVIRNDRSVLAGNRFGGTELDIWVPELGLAFEYNGDYWHDEGAGHKPFGYHVAKTRAAGVAGVSLMHVWEGVWLGDRAGTESRVRVAIRDRV